MNKKIYVLIFIILIMMFSSGITYSFFHSKSNIKSSDQSIAKFVFNAEKTNQINLDISDIKPGDQNEYLFTIENGNMNNISEVTIEYELTIKTYHFIPTEIKLYKILTSEETLIGECNETYSRNTKNELICNMPMATMYKNSKISDNYKLVVLFPKKYNDTIYSNLSDFINVEVASWQKI